MAPHQRITIILFCILTLPMPVCAETSVSDSAGKLVSTMRLDFAVLEALRWRTRINAKQAGASASAYLRELLFDSTPSPAPELQRKRVLPTDCFMAAGFPSNHNPLVAFG